MPIYTRKGDKGTTSLFDKTIVLKSHIRVETYGTIDELNSVLGVAISELKIKTKKHKYLINELIKIQHDLLDIGSLLANPKAKFSVGLDKRSNDFEIIIDKMTIQMPHLQNFILPGGGKAGSILHVARTLARRAERKIVALNINEKIDPNVVVYINRLSDLLFTAARFANFLEKRTDIIWTKKLQVK